MQSAEQAPFRNGRRPPSEPPFAVREPESRQHPPRLTAPIAYLRGWSLFAGVLLLSGCTTLAPDGGFSDVAAIAKTRTGQEAVWTRTPADERAVAVTVERLLDGPLTADDAVRIALINNRGLQATYAEVGVAEADLVQAGRLPNPGFVFSRTRGGEDVKIERTFTMQFVTLLTRPLAMRIESRYFAQAQLRVANEVVRVAAETRAAYVEAVAAAQTVTYMQQVLEAAEASADLGSRMAKAGNWSALDEAREQLFRSEATIQLARAKQAAVSQRERLTRLLGLTGTQVAFKLPDRLPDLPPSKLDVSPLEQLAVDQRLDIQAAKLHAEGLASSLGLTRATRLVNVLEVGYRSNSETGMPTETGYELTLEVPLFDWGEARVAKAEATYLQAVNRLAQTAIDARSEFRESYAAYATSYDLAKHYRDDVVPLRKKISEEYLLRYNGMLVSVFELLADAREQIASVNGYIAALKDFWVADAQLQRVLGGRAPLPPLSTGSQGVFRPAVVRAPIEQAN